MQPRAHRQVRIVSSTAALLSFISVSKGVALALPELAIAAFFLGGVTRATIGESAPWFILGACVIGAFVRAIDIESWALFVPGGLIGRSEQAFGRSSTSVATATVLTERLLLVALAAVLCGQYVASFGAVWIAKWSVTGRLTLQELVTVGAIVLIGLFWTRARLGLDLPSGAVSKGVWSAVGVMTALVVTGLIVVLRNGFVSGRYLVPPLPTQEFAGSLPLLVIRWFAAIALVLPAIGGGDTLARVAHEFKPPKLAAMRRTSVFATFFIFVTTVLSSLLFTGLVPRAETAIWAATPLTGLVRHLSIPLYLQGIFTVLLGVAAVLMLAPAARSALEDSEQLLRRLSADRRLRGFDPFNAAAGAAVMVIVVSGGQVTWLARAYGVSVAAIVLLKIAVLLRLRKSQTGPKVFRVPAIGLAGVGLLLAIAAVVILSTGDVPSIAGSGLIVGLSIAFAMRTKGLEQGKEDDSPFDLLPSPEVSPAEVDVRPGNVVVSVRHVHSLSHVVAAMEAAEDRDVVVVTVRLVGLDVDQDSGERTEWTMEERRLFSQVAALTERHGRPVRLMIVPSSNVFDGVIGIAVRLQSSEVFVGESSSLSASEQAQLLGEAWERAEKPANQNLRLVIHRQSGRTDVFHLGAHAPSLTPGDLDLIHRVWLDVVKVVGPHVHHHDVVRAALTQMEQQLKTPQREDALAVIRNVARPADELAAAVHEKNYTRLRDLVRNRHANDLAEILTDLSIEDQVIVFRILPRKNAAAVFEYLSLESQETLLKAMAQEDVASLLNNMAPDDRTMFLEELPASVTRQLLAMLTPAERSVALRLLGYPEDSVGRLMTPNYVSVREHWTVREVLDYVRAHGQDSETLNVIYVVDDQGQLIDDIRIREFLLTALDNHVSDLMDRRFVALKAADEQSVAVAFFRQYDRTALPVTDTAGMLIGIVTIDDVLDVAEAAATKEIQQIGGSEALDEPYMTIAFSRMIKKRAGWLTALFLGEMLTATAMGLFEGEIKKATVLAMFIPLIISSGGNSGSQATSLVIRALALGEMSLADWWRVTRREILAGLTLGALLGTVGFLRITIWSAFSTIYGDYWLLVAITVGLALVGVVLWGTLVGSLLPFVLRRLGFDPATSSAPLVATMVDVTGLIIYFTAAMVVLRGTLL